MNVELMKDGSPVYKRLSWKNTFSFFRFYTSFPCTHLISIISLAEQKFNSLNLGRKTNGMSIFT